MQENKNFTVIPVGSLEVNCVIIKCPSTGRAVIIDPGDEAERIIREIGRLKAEPEMIVNTHCHYDHIGAAEKLRTKYNIPFIVHELEEEYSADPNKNYSALTGKNISIEPDRMFRDNDILKTGSMTIRVIHTPGHTPGSCCFLYYSVLLSGDTLFAGSIGRTDLYGGDENTLIRSVRNKIMCLDDNIRIIPGHGRETTVRDEKRFNPYI